MKKEIERLIKTYRITEAAGGMISVNNADLAIKQNELDIIKQCKPQILGYLQEQKTRTAEAYRVKREKINAIEGLDEIERCKSAWDAYIDASDKMMESEDVFMPVARPAQTVNELKAKYPRAGAYLKAKHLSLSENYELSRIGDTALERVISEEDYGKVLADMDVAVKDFTNRHMWD